MGRFYSVFLVALPIALAYRQVFLPDLYSATIPQLQGGLDNGDFSSADLVNTYLARIEEVNLKSPSLRTVLELNANALNEAAHLDEERSKSGKRSPLHGIPILLDDNIALGKNRTSSSSSIAGSDALDEDASVVKRLRKAGAIILGKSTFSGTAHSKESLAGGQCTSAYFCKVDGCGSSSAVLTSIGLVTVSLSTETDGSITCSSANSNVVGIKPTVGLTPWAEEHQDTTGPIARSVLDAAIVLAIIAGKDPNDQATLLQPDIVPDYTAALRKRREPLKGKRIGVPRVAFLNDTLSGNDPSVNVLFEQALDTLKGLGATIVDPADLPSAQEILDIYSKAQINDLDVRAGHSSQSRLMSPEGVTDMKDTFSHNPSYDYELGATRGIDGALKEHNLNALVLPMAASKLAAIPSGKQSLSSIAKGFLSLTYNGQNLTAISGYPIVTVSNYLSVPMGYYPAFTTTGSPGMPIGLSFFGTAFSEFDLVGLAYAYEQKTDTRSSRGAFRDVIPTSQLWHVIFNIVLPEAIVDRLVGAEGAIKLRLLLLIRGRAGSRLFLY
ncbi:amidase signature enzyme [Agrocybe pediades]|nr:amidase signature enzyme [Agrocybe pediades]